MSATGGYTLSAGASGSLTLNAAAGTNGLIASTTGSQTILSPVTLASNETDDFATRRLPEPGSAAAVPEEGTLALAAAGAVGGYGPGHPRSLVGRRNAARIDCCTGSRAIAGGSSLAAGNRPFCCRN